MLIDLCVYTFSILFVSVLPGALFLSSFLPMWALEEACVASCLFLIVMCLSGNNNISCETPLPKIQLSLERKCDTHTHSQAGIQLGSQTASYEAIL